MMLPAATLLALWCGYSACLGIWRGINGRFVEIFANGAGMAAGLAFECWRAL